MRPWKTLARRTVLDRGRFLVVEDHTVELPDGRIMPDWSWIITPDYAIVVAETESGEFLCFRQTKYAVEGSSLAPVGGYIEPGEDPRLAAERELLEESGHQAREWIDLGHYRVDGNRGAGVAYLFLARRTRHVADVESDDLEEQELVFLSAAELRAALWAGEFKVLAWTTAVALALQYLDNRRKE
jgi:ADP-ribose pyrophosphatase